MPSTTWLLLAALLAPAALGAQSRSVVVARVTDAVAGRPLAGAELRVAGVAAAARSDSAGVARLAGLPRGRHTAEVRLVGYVPAAREVTLGGGDTIELAVALERAPVRLDTVVATERATAPATWLSAFETRRARGFGQFLTPAELDRESNRELGDVLASKLRGVRVMTGLDGMSRYIVSGRMRGESAFLGGPSEDQKRTSGRFPARACPMHVYLDGIFLYDYDVSFLETRSVAAVEAYGADAPPEFRRAGSECGVVLLWSRVDPKK